MVVIDCGADFRLTDPAAWERFYGGAHAGTWPYGLPELPGQREQLAGATRIAVPGCYPTVSTLALAPGVAAGLVDPDVVVVAASGTSGAGKAAKPHLLGSEVMGTASAYGVGGVHRHTPEITQNLSPAHRGATSRVSFTPTARARWPRGILATCSAPLAAGVGARGRPGRLRQGLRRRAVRAPAARGPVAADQVGARLQRRARCRSPSTRAPAGWSPSARSTTSPRAPAGAAVQCMNLALGLPETTGLPLVGVAP